MVNIIHININDTINNISININNINEYEKILTDYANYKGNGSIELVYSIENINIYGWKNGTDLNKHVLPNVKINLYGDIFIINNNLNNYSISEYGELYYILTNNENKNKLDINNNILLDTDTTIYL
tara:strand:+ start:106 stop:483 length:378 start_codon:yes stop_codon:yes gene_type:complete